MTSGEVTVETGKSQFIFYPPIFVYYPFWTWAHGPIALSMGRAGFL